MLNSRLFIVLMLNSCRNLMPCWWQRGVFLMYRGSIGKKMTSGSNCEGTFYLLSVFFFRKGFMKVISFYSKVIYEKNILSKFTTRSFGMSYHFVTTWIFHWNVNYSSSSNPEAREFLSYSAPFLFLTEKRHSEYFNPSYLWMSNPLIFH